MQSFDPHVVIKPAPKGRCVKAYQSDTLHLHALIVVTRSVCDRHVYPMLLSCHTCSHAEL
jgi:hypothetical protein